jgi:hypothetical protein
LPDPIQGPIDLVFFSLAMVFSALVAKNPRKTFSLLFGKRRVSQMSPTVERFLRFDAALVAFGSACLLVYHLFGK